MPEIKDPYKNVSERNQAATYRVCEQIQPKRLLIANFKGGCGKTTLSINLAAYYTRIGQMPALIDYDPQASSYHWIRSRHSALPRITTVKGTDKTLVGSTRTWQLKMPMKTNRIILDSPAGLCGMLMNELVRQAHIIVIPILPSPIDIRVGVRFIQELLLCQAFRSQPKPIGVVANRVRQNALCYSRLRAFLASLRIPLVTSIRDTQFYVRAAEHGLGLHDLHQPNEQDTREWQPLLDWIEQNLAKNDKKVANY